mgnify:CR=1 FL=1
MSKLSGQCERCDAVVVKKDLEQWYFKTTAFAEELLNDLDTLDGWPEKVKTMQRNWIGKSNGAELRFDIEGTDKSMTVYTTRPDTTYGVTFMVLAPESELVQELVAGTEYEADVNAFVQKMHTKTEIERTSSDAEKEGMFIGKYVINPVNGNKIPVWIANYVLADYGTGAIMAVPAHDDRDKEFAQKYNGPIAIRFSRGKASNVFENLNNELVMGKSETLIEGKHVAIIAVGNIIEETYNAVKSLNDKGCNPTLINALFLKPFDKEMIDSIAKKYKYIVTIEEGIRHGGYGEAVISYMADKNYKNDVMNLAIEDEFVEQGTVEELRKKLQLDADSICERILNFIK